MATAKSAVWLYFLKTSSQVANCQTCKNDIKYCGNTTNLRNHIKRKHPLIYKDLVVKDSASASTSHKCDDSHAGLSGTGNNQQSLATLFAKNQAYQSNSKRHMDISSSIMKFIAKDGMPIYTVEKEKRVSETC